ncbi:MAG TPA: sigma-70 family RNA polymerase sigma factor [Thermoanaerobaculia bacterium]|jgi:RNA polymerase sigma factor (TIGR02999 family)
MTKPRSHEVTRILEAISAGEEGAGAELFETVYEELRGIARAYMARERANHTLQPTAVVHEAYLRLLAASAPRWQSRAHFFSAAAEAMRRILVDHARRKLSRKRGGDWRRVESREIAEPDGELVDLLALDQALGRLEAHDANLARVVKLRYFAGLSVEDTARTLDQSPRTVNRSWTAARAWLRRELARDGRARSESDPR